MWKDIFHNEKLCCIASRPHSTLRNALFSMRNCPIAKPALALRKAWRGAHLPPKAARRRYKDFGEKIVAKAGMP
jgi:hypothetical protein